MLFWKIDEETIRCLINKDEISSLGFDLTSINEDAAQMEAFLETIVENSRNYIDWSPENGIQNYMARALPADQYLITISCTYQDEIIDRNISQIRKMTGALWSRVTEERLKEIEALTGEEKEIAFADLSKDLFSICSGEIDEEDLPAAGELPAGSGLSLAAAGDSGTAESKGAAPGTGRVPGDAVPGKDKKSPAREGVLPDRKLVFASLDEIITFAGILRKDMQYRSTLYKLEEDYVLLVRFDQCKKDSDAVHFILAAEEYGGRCAPVRYDEAYMMEHGKTLIRENALASLAGMVKS